MCRDWTSTTYSFGVRFTGEVPGCLTYGFVTILMISYYILMLLALYLCYVVSIILRLFLSITVLQYLPHLFHKGKQIFERFAVIFTVVIVWIYAHLLTVGGAYNSAAPKTQTSCRTDRAGLIDAAPWLV